MSPSAGWMAKQCQDAYTNLLEAELTYAERARAAVQDLSPATVRAAMVARTRWRVAVREVVLTTDRITDSDLRPEDLNLGHPVVDCWNPEETTTQNPTEGDLGATPDGILWVTRAGHLIHGTQSTKLTAQKFRDQGGALLTHQGRWTMVEEALNSRFPVGTTVEEPVRGQTMLVTCPGVHVDQHFPHGKVYTTRGLWRADALHPAKSQLEKS